jgi:enoyl-CoA hydratase
VVLLVDVDGPIATMTLNRPESRNALSVELTEAIQRTVTELDQRDDVSVIVITGADPAFCAGVDLKQLASMDRPAQVVRQAEPPPFYGTLPPHDTPVIGAINGPAVTGGLELVLACDFLIASERASFADTHARVGVMPGWGLTVRLPQLVGVNRARQMSFTGDYVDAQRAYDWGLVNEVVPHEELLPRAREVAAHIASIPSEHVREIRAMYAAMTGLIGEEAWARESEWSREWMAERFDQNRLAAERERIVERGRGQQ